MTVERRASGPEGRALGRGARRGAAVALAGVSLLAGCARYVPALFADRPNVVRVEDDRPIPVPSRASFDERAQIADVYLRRPLFDVVHPLDFPDAGDVNALDDVPVSSWYDPTSAGAPEPGETPPVPPLSVLDERALTSAEALAVVDSRGIRYELVTDPAAHRGLYTGADVLGGYLLRGLGLRAPACFIVNLPDAALTAPAGAAAARLSAWLADRTPSVHGRRRVSATRWPDGKDVGVTGDFGARRDDPNDTVPHNDRRTLRAMKVFAQWLGFETFGVRQTRDVYVGAPGEGHVVHYVVGASHALGTHALRDEPTVDEQSGTAWYKLVTLGLSPPVVHPAHHSPFPALGYLPPSLEDEEYTVSPPYSPFVRLTPPDAYWAAKALADPALRRAVRAGIAAARLPASVSAAIVKALASRRRELVVRALAAVTPLEPERATSRFVLVRDTALLLGVDPVRGTRYDVAYLSTDGADVAPERTVVATGVHTALPLPREVTGRIVLHVRSRRGDEEAPRSCDIHVVVAPDGTRVIGIRH